MMILLMILLLRPNISRTFTPHYILGVTGAVAVAGLGAAAGASGAGSGVGAGARSNGRAASAVIAPLNVELVGLRLSHGQHY